MPFYPILNRYIKYIFSKQILLDQALITTSKGIVSSKYVILFPYTCVTIDPQSLL